LQEIIRAHSGRITLSAEAAARFMDLVGKGDMPWRGEKYPI
jgi:hypothetical protein